MTCQQIAPRWEASHDKRGRAAAFFLLLNDSIAVWGILMGDRYYDCPLSCRALWPRIRLEGGGNKRMGESERGTIQASTSPFFLIVLLYFIQYAAALSLSLSLSLSLFLQITLPWLSVRLL
jgi:hypothetical protein